jgi:parvulin-like peptidyl-prolyl isomerase
VLKVPLSRYFNEPLIQFVILGFVIFGLYTWAAPQSAKPSEDILVTSEQVQQLRTRFERMRGRQPNRAETEGLIDDFIRETVYYREALALGLDRDDPVIRNRMRQKFTFLQDELNSLEVTESELENYYRQNKQKYASPGTYSFTQVYLGTKLPSEIRADANRVKTALSKGENPSTLGEATLLPTTMQQASTQEVANRFGEAFTAALAEMPLNQWSNPVTSPFGSHLVLIERKAPASEPALVDIKPELERDLLYEKRLDQEQVAYQALQSNYRVTVHWPENQLREAGTAN